MIAPIRVLAVDDSALMRVTLSKRLGAEPGIEVVGTARDGLDALGKLRALRPDVITLDVEMPGLDGLSTLAQIMAEQPTPVIMASSKTREGTETTVRALTLGAVDFVTKASPVTGSQHMITELADKIRQAAGTRVCNLAPPSAAGSNGRLKAPVRPLLTGDVVLVVGSSTGGPQALRRLFAALPIDLNAAIVVVQHMPAGFTRSLAERLDEGSGWHVKEASIGDRLRCGQTLLAPGGSHLIIERGGEVRLSQDAPVNNVRPAVDVTMRCIVETFGKRVVGVVLTGMGRDGTAGAQLIHQAGGWVIAEAESTCVVYGMPRSVVEAGAADYVAPLPEIAGMIHRLLVKPKHE